MKKHFHKTIYILLLSLFLWMFSGFIVAQTTTSESPFSIEEESILNQLENTTSDSEESVATQSENTTSDSEESVATQSENTTSDSEESPFLVEEEVEEESIPTQSENTTSDSEESQFSIEENEESVLSQSENTTSFLVEEEVEEELLLSQPENTTSSEDLEELQFSVSVDGEEIEEESVPTQSENTPSEELQFSTVLSQPENTTSESQSSAENTNIPENLPAAVQKDSKVTQQFASPITITEYNLNNPEIKALIEQLQHLKLHNAILATQNLIQAEKYQWEISQLQQEKHKLQLLNELQQEKNAQQLAKLQADRNKLLLENELYAAEQNQLLAQLTVIKTRLELENQIQKQETHKFLAALDAQREQLAIQNAIALEKQKQEELRIQLETAKLGFEMAQFEFEKNKRALEREELSEKISEREQREQWESQVNKPIRYLKEPYIDGHLVISDRKIELGEVILPNTAAYINERIHYYNNKNAEYPIFLMIDVCYGGSVMEGAKILEAMHSSHAPVYVVVKTMAASLAAVITTLAEESYAYPNAIILHHQLFGSAEGNPQQIKEQLEIAQEWTQRIMRPVAGKMGVTVEKFVQQMYENNSSGEWFEFANVATKLKWVNQVVKDIRDTSIIKSSVKEEVSEEVEKPIVVLNAKEKMDSQKQRYVTLPSLNPLDMYFLYNPNNYYR